MGERRRLALGSALRARWNSQGSGTLLAKGASGALIGTAAGAVLAYASQVLLARLMGASGYGTLSYVLSWLTIFQIVATFGLPQTVVRFVAAYNARDDREHLRGLLRWSDAVALGASLAVGIPALLVALTVSRESLERISPDPDALIRTIQVATVALPLTVLWRLRTQTVRALGFGALSMTLEQAMPPLVMIVCLGVFLQVGTPPLTAPQGMALNLLASLVMLAIGARLVFARRPARLRDAAPRYQARAWLGMALPSIFIASMTVLLNGIDRVMIGSLLNTDLAGIYGASTRTAQLVSFGLIAVNSVLAPMVSASHETDQRDRLERILSLAALGIFLWTTAGASALLLLGRPILALFGPDFLAGYVPLVIMVVAQAVNSSCGSVGLLLNMTGHQRMVAVVFAIAAPLNVLLNWLLIPRYGMNGAALATGLALASWNVALVVMARRTLGLNPTIFRNPARWWTSPPRPPGPQS